MRYLTLGLLLALNLSLTPPVLAAGGPTYDTGGIDNPRQSNFGPVYEPGDSKSKMGPAFEPDGLYKPPQTEMGPGYEPNG